MFTNEDFLILSLDGAPVGTKISAAMIYWSPNWRNHIFTKRADGDWETDGISRRCSLDQLTNIGEVTA